MAWRNINLANGEVAHINDTEYVGIYEDGFLPAKCIPSGAEDANALTGIADLWSNLSESSNHGFLETRAAKMHGAKHLAFYFLLLYAWLRRSNQDISHHLRPVFLSQGRISPSLRGQVDYFRSNVLNRGLLGNFSSRVTSLGFSLRQLMALRDAYEFLSSSNLAPSDQYLRDKFNHEVSYGLSLLSEVPRSINPEVNALFIREHSNGKGLGLPPKLQNLAWAVSLAVDIILNRENGVLGAARGTNGLLFNMNYLLQLVIQKACEGVGGKRTNSLFNRGINKVVNANGMEPDVFGAFRDGIHFIIDAKHKIFVSPRQNKSQFGISDGISQPIDRDDFYQIVSYTTTHHLTEGPARYGLAGLWISDRKEADEYILPTLEPIEIRFKNQHKVEDNHLVSRLAVDFFRVLSDVGRGVDRYKVVHQLGTEIISKLEVDARKSEMRRRHG